MNIDEEKRKNNFLMQTNKRCANLPRKQKILIKKSSWQYTQTNSYLGAQIQCKSSH
jgi:hypothetical protein